MVIGRGFNSDTTRSWKGAIDEIAFWSERRTADQIAADLAGIVNPASQSNLIAYYQGEGNANSSTRPNVDGIFKGAVTYVPGYVTNRTDSPSGLVVPPSQAFHFGGGNGFVEIPDNDKFEGSALSIEAWVKFDSLAPFFQDIVGKYHESDPGQRSWYFGTYRDGSLEFGAYGSGASQGIRS